MNESKKGRQPLADCVFRPLAAGGLILCAAFTAAAAAAVYPSALEAACLGWLVLGAGTVFVLVGGGVLWLLRSVCQRYLSPVAQAATAAAQAAAGDQTAVNVDLMGNEHPAIPDDDSPAALAHPGKSIKGVRAANLYGFDHTAFLRSMTKGAPTLHLNSL